MVVFSLLFASSSAIPLQEECFSLKMVLVIVVANGHFYKIPWPLLRCFPKSVSDEEERKDINRNCLKDAFSLLP